jgi:hypothetical protein
MDTIITNTNEPIEIQQGETTKRKRGKSKVQGDKVDSTLLERLIGLDNTQENSKKEKIKVTPFIDPNARPKPTFYYKKILLKNNETENEELNNILNTASFLVRIEEKVLPSGDVLVFVIYAIAPKVKTEEEK